APPRSDGSHPRFDGMVPSDCATIPVVVRDFDVSHPDFEHDNPGLVEGLVMNMLDAEHKPLYAHGTMRVGGIDSTDSFHQWYRDVPGINFTFNISVPLTQDPATGHSLYDNPYFFPIDGMGWGMSGTDDMGREHNFGFTDEIHTAFVYHGGEIFTFRGDDDLW